MVTEEGITTMSVYIDGGEPVSPELIKTLTTAIDRIEDDGPGHALILRAGGVPANPTPAGIDIQLINKWERALRRLERLDALTVAVADGPCGGVALEALLATDYRFATATASLCPSPWPGMGLYRLANQAGAAVVRRAVLLGVPIPAAEARDIGLIDELVADPATAVAAVPGLLGMSSTSELAIRRRLLLDAVTTSYEEALGRHLAACDRQLRRAEQARAA
jgi:isomerase DpgB